MIRLLITPDGADHPLMHSFDVSVVSIGSAPENVLRLTGVGISKRHLILRDLDGVIEVEDLGGSNGTYLDGKRVRGKRVVPPGHALIIPGHAISVAEERSRAEKQKAAPSANLGDAPPIGGLVSSRAAAWHERPDAVLLLSGTELADALRWRSAVGEAASAASQRELDFIAASVVETRGRRRRALAGMVGVGLACALALVGSRRVLAGGVDAYSQSAIGRGLATIEEKSQEARREGCLKRARELVGKEATPDDPDSLTAAVERLACASALETKERPDESEVYDQLESRARSLLRSSQGRLLSRGRAGVGGEVLETDDQRCVVLWGDSSGEAYVWDRCAPARSPVTVKGPSPIRALAVTADGRAFAVDDGARLRTWPVNGGGSGVRRLELAGARSSPGAAAISSGGRYVALAAVDEATVQLYDLARGEPPIAGHTLGGLTSATNVLAFTPDEGGLLAVDGARLLTWNLRGRPGKPRVLATHRSSMTALAVTTCRPSDGPEQHLVLTGGADGDVQVRPLSRAGKSLSVHAGSSPVVGLTISSDCRYLLAGGRRSVELWELARPTSSRTLDLEQPLTALESMPEGHLVVAAAGDELLLIDPTSREEPRRIHRRSAIRALRTAGEATVIASHDDGSTRASDLMASAGAASTRANHPGPVRAAALDRDGRRLVSASANQAYLWALDGGEPRRIGAPLENEGPIAAVASSESGDWAAAAGDGELNLWFVGQGQPTRHNFSFRGRATALAFGGSWLALGTTDGASFVDLRSNGDRTLQELQADEVSALVFVPEGAQLALGGVRATLGLVDLNAMSGGRGKTSQNHAKGLGITAAIVASPDGAWFAAGGEQGDLRIWKAPWEGPSIELSGPVGVVHAIAASPDGHLLAAAGDEAAIHIFRADDAKPVRRLDLGGTPVTALVFVDDEVLVSGGSDGSLRRWSLTSSTREGSLLGAASRPEGPREVEIGTHGSRISRLLVTPDDFVLSIADDDPTIHLWPATRRRLYEVAVTVVGG